MTGEAVRYCLMIGDLTIDQVLQIRKACDGGTIGKDAFRKVAAAVECVWQARQSYKTSARAWDEFCKLKYPDQYPKAKQRPHVSNSGKDATEGRATPPSAVQETNG
jgi:hypothetical protein